MVESYLESNEKKKLKSRKEKLSKEEQERLLKIKEDFKKFKDLTELDVWKECETHLKDDCYNQLSFTPGDGGDWWLKYCWGIRVCLERIKGYAKNYDEAIKQLSV